MIGSAALASVEGNMPLLSGARLLHIASPMPPQFEVKFFKAQFNGSLLGAHLIS